MIEYIIWGLSFLSLWTTLFWINYIYFQDEKKGRLKQLPTVSIVIPSFNEEKTIGRTIVSLVNLDYPKEKLEVIVVNDGSTDETARIVRQIIKKHPQYSIRLINKENAGKAVALNTALKIAKGELFACIDADSVADENALKSIMDNFAEPNTGIVISVVKVEKPNCFYERIQKAEYVMSNFVRRLTSSLGTLAIAHGGFSVLRTSILRKIGGFSNENGMTEDLEVAMRMRYNGYGVKMQWGSFSHTHVPKSFKALWKQRIRWYRGYIYNHLKFKDMFFNAKYGLYGLFQMPLNALAVLTMLTTVSVISYGLIKDAYEFMVRTLTIKGYLLNHVFTLPDLGDLVLGKQVHIYLPIILSSLIGVYVISVAHRQIKESLLKHLHFVFLYFTAFPYLTAIHWLSAITKELFNSKRRWR